VWSFRYVHFSQQQTIEREEKMKEAVKSSAILAIQAQKFDDQMSKNKAWLILHSQVFISWFFIFSHFSRKHILYPFVAPPYIFVMNIFISRPKNFSELCFEKLQGSAHWQDGNCGVKGMQVLILIRVACVVRRFSVPIWVLSANLWSQLLCPQIEY